MRDTVKDTARYATRRVLSVLALALATAGLARAQESGAAALANAVDVLRPDLPRVLYIAAHPDDEDTRLITWLSRGGYAEVAYLSLNRGEGGQNVIGRELGDALGVVRTQELLSARRVDGGHQYFTRAYDFGYSKSAEESFAHWPRDSLIRDIVRIVRAFRPHVLASTFSGTPRDAHGQHQVAGRLTREAYDLAADTVRFPVREFGPPWQPLKLYRLAFFAGAEPTIRLPVGEYNPLAGRTFAQIANDSRSSHKSQGYEPTSGPGQIFVQYLREATRVNAETAATQERSLFDGLPAISRPPVTASNGTAQSLDVFRPATALPLIAAFEPRDGWEQARYDRAARLATAVAFEALAARAFVAVGDTVTVAYSLHNRGSVPVRIDSAAGSPPGEWIAPGASVTWSAPYRPAEADQPWWLQHPRRGAMYEAPVTGVPDSERDRRPWPQVRLATAELRLPFRASTQTMHQIRGPLGDQYVRLFAMPRFTVTPTRDRAYVRAGVALNRMVNVVLRSSASDERQVTVRLRPPAGLSVEPREQQVAIPAGGARTLSFRISGTPAAGDYPVGIEATSDGERHAQAVQQIEYDHIAPQRLYRPAEIRLTAATIDVPANLRVGYIQGMADEGPEVLRDLGIPVTLIAPADVPGVDLSQFSTVVVGPRVYETGTGLLQHNQRLFDYAAAGGRLVVQFGQYSMGNPGILPYRITITRPPARVTDENAAVTFTAPDAPELNYPNRITRADFEGWVQERATFMPTEFDSRYRVMLAMSDPGEEAKQTSVLVAPMGSGTYVYVTLALFRQLAEGVPGAARIFVNLLTPPTP